MRHLIIALMLAVVVSGCGAEIERKPLSLTVLYPTGGRGDVGFAASVSHAVVFGRWQFRLNLEEIEPATIEETSLVLDQVLTASSSETLVIAVGFEYQEAISSRECTLGAASIMYLDGSQPPCAGLRSVTYRTFEPSFEAGVAAIEKIRLLNAEREQSGQIALPLRAAAFGGVDIPPVREFLSGFAAGVDHAGGELLPIETIADDSSGFENIEVARVLARTFFEQGATVVFPVAGRAGLGAVEAAADRRATIGEPHFVIGVDSDMSVVAPDVVLASVLKRLDRTVREVMFRFADGDFESGDVVVGSDDGSTELLLNLLHDSTVDATIPLPLTSAVRAAREAALAAEAAYFAAGDK